MVAHREFHVVLLCSKCTLGIMGMNAPSNQIISDILMQEARALGWRAQMMRSAREKKLHNRALHVAELRGEVENLRNAPGRAERFTAHSHTAAKFICPYCWVMKGTVAYLSSLEVEPVTDRLKCPECGRGHWSSYLQALDDREDK